MKRIAIAVLMVCMILQLCACSNKDVKNVESLINELETSGEGWSEKLKNARTEYDNLCDEDKEKVSNYDILVEKESKFDENMKRINISLVEGYIDILEYMNDGDNDSSDITYGGNFIDQAREEYDKLDEDSKLLIKNYNLLIEVEKKREEVRRVKSINAITAKFENFDFDGGRTELIENKSNMTDEEIEQCMMAYGKWYCFKYAENDLISRLKNPYSYVRTSGSSTVSENSITREKGENKLCKYFANIRIGYIATNSFGGMVSDNYKNIVFFNINYEECKIEDVMLNLDYHKVLVSIEDD